MVLAKITIKHAYARGVRGVAAYRGSVCVSRAVRYVDWQCFESRTQTINYNSALVGVILSESSKCTVQR